MKRVVLYCSIALGVITVGCGGQSEPAAPASTVVESAPTSHTPEPASEAPRETPRGPAVANATVDAADVRGSLTSDAVLAVVRRHLNEVRLCYESELGRQSDLRGRVTVTLLVGATGAVQAASLSSSTLGSAPVEQCIVSAARTWTFPAPEGGGVVGVNLPFTLSSSREAPSPTAAAPVELAQAALDEGRYEDVCAYLVTRGLSSVVCDWIVATARANHDQALSTARFERFLRDQHVRRVSGSIVGWYDDAHNEYEVRVSGRPAILVAGETAFETTGRFTMWVQQHGTSDEVLTSGREVSVPVYREWPLYQAILDMARARGDAAGPAAVSLLRELLRAWETDYCYTPDPDGLGECYVDPSLPPPGVAPPSPEVAMEELRGLLPSTWDEHSVVHEVTSVAAYLREHALRYDQLAEFPATRLSALRSDPDLRARGWVASGTVVQVLATADAPAIVFWRGDTCTYAIVPNAASISNHADVRFAGVAIQPYRWRNLVGREQDCIVAVGYLGGRG